MKSDNIFNSADYADTDNAVSTDNTNGVVNTNGTNDSATNESINISETPTAVLTRIALPPSHSASASSRERRISPLTRKPISHRYFSISRTATP